MMRIQIELIRDQSGTAERVHLFEANADTLIDGSVSGLLYAGEYFMYSHITLGRFVFRQVNVANVEDLA